MELGQTQSRGADELVDDQVVGLAGEAHVAPQMVVGETVFGEFGRIGMDDPQTQMRIGVPGVHIQGPLVVFHGLGVLVHPLVGLGLAVVVLLLGIGLAAHPGPLVTAHPHEAAKHQARAEVPEAMRHGGRGCPC